MMIPEKAFVKLPMVHDEIWIPIVEIQSFLSVLYDKLNKFAKSK